MSAVASPPVAAPAAAPRRSADAWRWLPPLAALAWLVGVLLAAGTAPVDLVRYAGYVGYAVVLPGTLVYRTMRRRPHTLVEDLSIGACVGLALELPAWAVLAAFGRQEWLAVWPLLVIAVFVAVPGLRRHWMVRGHQRVPLGWAWAVAGVVAFFTTYLSITFLERNPVLPNSEATRQYLDLAYQLSLAGEAKHRFPMHVPQVAEEPLHYHWFGYVHMAATSIIGGIDLPVVALRLAVPGLCALAVVLTAVVGWRVSGRPYAGVVAAVLFFVVGEINFTDPVTMPFGTQASFVVWHGMSMIYSWVLLLPLIAVLAELAGRAGRPGQPIGRVGRPGQPIGRAGRPGQLVGRAGRSAAPGEPAGRVVHVAGLPGRTASPRETEGVPPIGRGAWALVGLLMLASSGAKASSVPVVALALAITAAVLLFARRRVPWAVVGAGLIAGGAQLFAMAVLYRFQAYGLSLNPMDSLALYWQTPAGPGSDGVGPPTVRPLAVTAVVAAFLINMQARAAGIVALLWSRRGRPTGGQVFLLAGAVAGPAFYLMLHQPGGGNQYFTRAGFTFAVLLSAWGYVEVLRLARLSRREGLGLAVASVAFAVLLTVLQLRYAPPAPQHPPFAQLVPLLRWSLVLAVIVLLVAVAWRALARHAASVPPARAARGGLVALTAILLAGAPGLVMDMAKSQRFPNGGAYATVPMPRSRIDAARWVRDHSAPEHVLATNAHCLVVVNGWCDARSFWLSAYAERRVLVEGWSFAPRVAALTAYTPFWDQELLRRNDRAFTEPTAQALAELRSRHGVRWLVVDRTVEVESPELRRLAKLRYDDGRMAVYEVTREALVGG